MQLVFLPNETLAVVCDNVMTLFTPDGLVTGKTLVSRALAFDTIGCRLWNVYFERETTIVDQHELVHVVEQRGLVFKYESDAIHVLPKTIHGERHALAFALPQSILARHYVGFARLKVVAHNDAFYALLLHPTSLVVLDLAAHAVANILPLNRAALADAVDCVVAKGLLVVVQLLPSLIHLRCYNFPSFFLLHESLEEVPTRNPMFSFQTLDFPADREHMARYIPTAKRHSRETSEIEMVQDCFVDEDSDGVAPSARENLHLPVHRIAQNAGVVILNAVESQVVSLFVGNLFSGIILWKLDMKELGTMSLFPCFTIFYFHVNSLFFSFATIRLFSFSI